MLYIILRSDDLSRDRDLHIAHSPGCFLLMLTREQYTVHSTQYTVHLYCHKTFIVYSGSRDKDTISHKQHRDIETHSVGDVEELVQVHGVELHSGGGPGPHLHLDKDRANNLHS